MEILRNSGECNLAEGKRSGFDAVRRESGLSLQFLSSRQSCGTPGAVWPCLDAVLKVVPEFAKKAAKTAFFPKKLPH
jgi:hypothetical protein